MITLEANYSKKIGLPNYSSHQFSVSLKTELTDVSQVEQESAKLYSVLQQSVDSNIRHIGYLPGSNGNGNQNGNGNGQTKPQDDKWACTDKQRDLILKTTTDYKLDKTKVDQLAIDRFGVGVKLLNKLQASGLIKELLDQTGQSKPRSQQFQKAGAR